MKKMTFFTLLVGAVLLLAACGMPGMGMRRGGGMGRMMGGDMDGMMARHHADIPDEYAGLTNPIAADDASLERGAKIYAAQCVSCHGDGGMGDGPAAAALDPAPAPIAHTGRMLGDDYLFWRISEGGQMEPFNSSMIAWKDILDEESRWDVINYIQALGSGTIMPMTNMGGAAFDPEMEAEMIVEMLDNAVEQGVITEEESATFSEVHEFVEEEMMQNRAAGMGGMEGRMNELLTDLAASGELTQEQVDTFTAVHDRLEEAGLMQ